MTRNHGLPLRILREIVSPVYGSYLRPTYYEIAKKLGVDEETVRVRVRQAIRAGTILGWRLEINPHLLRHEATSVMLEVDDPSSKQLMISQIKLIDEVILIVDFFERPIRVIFYHENDRDRDRRLDLIKSICGDKNPTSWQLAFPPCDVKLKRIDWEILRELRKDPMQSNREIAKELRVSTRTVKRRLSFMAEGRALYSLAMGNVKRQEGVTYFFLVDCSNGRKKNEVDKEISSKLENAVFVDTRNKQYSAYAAVFHNMSEADETYRWIKSLDGAENTRMSMMREVVTVPDWFDKEIDKHLFANS